MKVPSTRWKCHLRDECAINAMNPSTQWMCHLRDEGAIYAMNVPSTRWMCHLRNEGVIYARKVPSTRWIYIYKVLPLRSCTGRFESNFAMKECHSVFQNSNKAWVGGLGPKILEFSCFLGGLIKYFFVYGGLKVLQWGVSIFGTRGRPHTPPPPPLMMFDRDGYKMTPLFTFDYVSMWSFCMSRGEFAFHAAK